MIRVLFVLLGLVSVSVAEADLGDVLEYRAALKIFNNVEKVAEERFSEVFDFSDVEPEYQDNLKSKSLECIWVARFETNRGRVIYATSNGKTVYRKVFELSRRGFLDREVVFLEEVKRSETRSMVLESDPEPSTTNYDPEIGGMLTRASSVFRENVTRMTQKFKVDLDKEKLYAQVTILNRGIFKVSDSIYECDLLN